MNTASIVKRITVEKPHKTIGGKGNSGPSNETNTVREDGATMVDDIKGYLI